MNMYRIIIFLSFILSTYDIFAQVASAGTSININTPEFYEHAPALSADGKTMIFQSNRDGGFKLYETRLQSDNKWSEPKVIHEIHPSGKPFVLIGGPSLTYDGSNLYFCGLLEGGEGDMDIYHAQKKGDTWSTAVNLGKSINSDKYEGFPSISAEGNKLFFTRLSSAPSCYKILYSEKSNEGIWQEPKDLPRDLNAGCSKSPRILSDGRTLIYSSKSDQSKENFDLFKSVLSKDGKWSDPAPLHFVNTSESEQIGTITEMNELMYYMTKGDLYSIGVPPEIILNKIVLTTIDERTKKTLIANIKIRDRGKEQLVLKSDSTNAEGKYQTILLPGRKYNFELSAAGYESQSIELGFMHNEDFSRIEKIIAFKSKTRQVVLKISDGETNKGLTVDIKITNLETNEETIIHETVGRDGKYAVNLREGNTYNVEVSSKEGYAYSTMKIAVPASKAEELTASTDTSDTGMAFVPIVTPEEAISHEIKVMPLKQGRKLLLKDIFFEFNAHELKDSSYVELNRLIELLNENPNIKIEIAAHTDDVGSAEFNLKLSAQRAQVIEDYLVSKGIQADRLKPIGLGKSKPIASNTTEEGRAKNRRVELKILETK